VIPPTGPPLSCEAFVAAVERLCLYRNHVIVVKLGGSAMEEPLAIDACLRSVAVLNQLGVSVVLVHGGGKPIDRAMAEAGLTAKKVAGRRYTDDATLGIVVRVLCEINRDIVARLRALGVPAVGHEDLATFPLRGERLLLPGPDLQPVDLGHVGKVTSVRPLTRTRGHDPGTPRDDSGRGCVPVLPSLAVSVEGAWLNVNADTAASAVAGALKAEKAIFLTDTPGVLRERHRPESLIPKLTEAECRELIASGTIEGGMVPKVEACFEALQAGARAALIVDGRVPFSLLDVFLNEPFKGTEITG
jgi:acetylglutamate kinase